MASPHVCSCSVRSTPPLPGPSRRRRLPKRQHCGSSLHCRKAEGCYNQLRCLPCAGSKTHKSLASRQALDCPDGMGITKALVEGESLIGSTRTVPKPIFKSLAECCGATSGILFLMSSPAWAGAEVAQQSAQSATGIFGDIGNISAGFTSAFLLIFFSELGDKTFFIAALLATRKSAGVVFTGTFGALIAMTLISVTLGRAFHYLDGVLPLGFGQTELPVDDLAAVILLVYFGVSTLVDASSMERSKAEEEKEEAELAIAGINSDGIGLKAAGAIVTTFTLVFVAEWGDKSFFSTIALAAAASPLGVVLGAIAGHGIATLLAVLGGSILGTYVSEKVIAYTGGTLFLVFAAATLLEIVNGR